MPLSLALFLLVNCVQSWVLYTPYDGGTRGEGYKLKGKGDRWSSPRSFNLSRVAFFWGLDPNPASTRGLSGGISWAIHPEFCDRISSKFRGERLLLGLVTFMKCDSLRNAIDLAFSTWSANHPHVAFTDLSDLCVGTGGLDEDGNYCVDAEVTISTHTMEDEHSPLAAYVIPDVTRIDRAPYSTSGDLVPDGLGMLRADMRLSIDLCWYLDETFCASFHQLGKEVGINTTLMMRGILMSVFIVSIVYVLRVCLRVYAAARGTKRIGEALLPMAYHSRESIAHRERRSKTMRWGMLIEYLARMNMLLFLTALFGTMFAPIFYNTVVIPCIECHSFSNTLAHEVGHLLGFHHVDTLPSMNLRATQAMGPKICHNPLDYVELALPIEGTDTFMNSVAEHRPSTCLTPDDLEGLQFLYPTCSDTVLNIPVCTKPERLTGWLRLLIATMVPYSLVTLAVIAAQNGVRSCQRKHVHKLRENVRAQRAQATWLRTSAKASRALAAIGPTMRNLHQPGVHKSTSRARPQHPMKQMLHNGVTTARDLIQRTRVHTPRSTPPSTGGAGNPPSPVEQDELHLAPPIKYDLQGCHANNTQHTHHSTRPPPPNYDTSSNGRSNARVPIRAHEYSCDPADCFHGNGARHERRRSCDDGLSNGSKDRPTVHKQQRQYQSSASSST